MDNAMNELLTSIANAARPAAILIEAVDTPLETFEPLSNNDQQGICRLSDRANLDQLRISPRKTILKSLIELVPVNHDPSCPGWSALE
jgi:hypothetical protein